MAGYDTYPPGTPGPTDQVLYLADPAGTPSLKLADLAHVFVQWEQIVDMDGSTMTGWTAVEGNLTSIDGYLLSQVGGTKARTNLPGDVASPVVIESEMQFPTGGSANRIEIGIGGFTQLGAFDSPAMVGLRHVTGTFQYTIVVDETVQFSDGFFMNRDQWVTVRMVCYGSRRSLYLNTQFIKSFEVPHQGRIDSLWIWSETAGAMWRNIRAWKQVQTLP